MEDKNQDVLNGPNVIDPVIPSAVGSRNSLYRGSRDEYFESQHVVDEEVDKILNHVGTMLPPETLDKLEVMANIKSKLHNYYNQTFQNMFNRYITTAEDELAKKYRDLIDVEERRNLNRYSPRSVIDLVHLIGGPDKFNTNEIEKSVINIYGHLQGAIQRGVNELEQNTNSLLRKKMDVGAFLRGENAYSIVRCCFKPSMKKPNSVLTGDLSINILESEIISPVLHVKEKVSDIVKKLLSSHIINSINNEVDKLDEALIEEGKEELNDNEKIFEKIKSLDKYYTLEGKREGVEDLVSSNIYEILGDVENFIPTEDFDQLDFKTNIKKIVDDLGIKHRGFNTLVNVLTQILDSSRMGYEHIENFKNKRICEIREYFDTSDFPDECFKIKMEYVNQDQINEMRKAYDLQYNELEKEITKIESVLTKSYNDHCKSLNKLTYSDMIEAYLGKSNTEANTADQNEPQVIANEYLWDEVTFVPPKDTEVESLNKTYVYLDQNLKKRVKNLRTIANKQYTRKQEKEKLVVLGRINFIEKELVRFITDKNPYQIHPGILLNINIITISRKQVTLKNMSNVLNEFLNQISKGFKDTAFAGFARRRSTVKDDIDQVFGAEPHTREEIEEKVEA